MWWLQQLLFHVQAGAILKAEVYGIPRPDWASDAAAVAAAAGKVVVPEFQPKQGVKIETDPKVGVVSGSPGYPACMQHCWDNPSTQVSAVDSEVRYTLGNGSICMALVLPGASRPGSLVFYLACFHHSIQHVATMRMSSSATLTRRLLPMCWCCLTRLTTPTPLHQGWMTTLSSTA